MSKDELEKLAAELSACAKKLLDLAESLKQDTSGAAAESEPIEKPLTLEYVRAVLAQKARTGFTVQVRELLQKHGADMLSAVDPAKYSALLADAEVLESAN